MARYCGKIGFAVCAEETTVHKGQTIKTGNTIATIVERKYYGDYMRNPTVYNQENPDGHNRNIDCSIRVSIIANPFALENLPNIRYAEYMGTKWAVKNFEIVYPRILLTLGGVYNGEEPSGSTD